MLKQGRLHFIAVYLFFFCAIAFGQQNDSIRILEKSLAEKLPDTVRLKTLIRLSDICMADKNKTNKGEVYISKALELALEKKIPVPYRLRWLNAMLLKSHDMPKKAVSEMETVISYLEEKKSLREAGEARNYLAQLLFFSGQFNESIDFYKKNIELARKKNLEGIIPYAYLGIANVYLQTNNTVEREKYLELFLEEAKKESNPALIGMACFRIGVQLMFRDSNLNTVMPYLQEALKIGQSIQDSLSVLTTLNMIGWFYYVKHDPDSSLQYYLQAVQFCPSSNIDGFAKPYGNIGNIYRDKKEYGKAMFYYNLCEQYGLKTKDFYILAALYKDMSDMYIIRADYKLAYDYYVAFKKSNDSLNAGKYLEGLGYARAKFDTEAKEKELQLLNLKLDQNKYFTYGLAAFVILLLIIGFLLYYQSKMAARRKISEMNNKLSEITHANLRQQMNPHFIFNTLNSIQYYMYQHDKIATNNYLTKFSRLIRKILENSQYTLVPIKDELDVIQLYLELETLRFKEKFTYEIIIDEEIDTLTYKIPTMLIQPYVENAVCHGLMNKPDHGLLIIKMQVCDRHICCTIEDNGIGREAAMNLQKQKDSPHNSLGTKITESRINITNALYGTDLKVIFTDLTDAGNNPAGTRVELQLPMMT
ncbi:MAG: histidine kinase [Bacteroidetes bacterium]|nr:histidine kinase [Bacteroidota bacterium]